MQVLGGSYIMDFLSTIKSTKPETGSVRIFWLGQAGFLIQTSAGYTIAIDPYFSDCVMRLIPQEGQGFKRLTPPLCMAEDTAFSALLITHEHNDHFDVDSIEALMANGHTHLYANAPVVNQIQEMGLDVSRVHMMMKSSPFSLDKYKVIPMDCDHGELAPEALGLMFDFGFTRIYFAGDTALSPDRLKQAITAKPEVAILPINGAYGNLNSREAAEYSVMLGCKICIPCHFWTFPLHHGDPQSFLDEMAMLAPNCEARLLCQGEYTDIKS